MVSPLSSGDVMRFARIESGLVVEIVEAAGPAQIADRYHADLHFLPCGVDVQVGWVADGGALRPPPRDAGLFARNIALASAVKLEECRAAALDCAAAGVAVPKEWIAYRADIVAIRDGAPQERGFVWPSAPEWPV